MKLNRHHSRFTVGEYSRAGITRIDTDRGQLAAEIQENLIPSLAGDARFRPGTEYLDTSRDNEQARLIPFVRDTDDFALIEMTAGKVRIMVDDSFITRETVTSTLVNPNFDLATGWTTAASAGAYSNIQSGTYNNQLVMGAFAQGSNASAVQAVTIPSEELGTVHALRIDVFRGPVLFRIGSTSGGQDVVSEQILQRGTHSLAFTPTAAIASTYYIWFGTRFETEGVVNSCQFESGEVMELDAPWTAAELREVSFDQAADVVFFAHENWQPRQLQRRGRTSWSMVLFETDAGPTEVVSDGTTLNINSTRNAATITASRDYFTPDMVGALVRAYHETLNASYLLAGDSEFTETWRVIGIKGTKNNDRKFSYQVTGFGSGTMHMQRSISGEDGDFLDYTRDNGTLTTITGNINVTHNGSTEDANLIAYHRIGFKDGGYGSGAIQVNVQYELDGGFGWGRIIDYYSPRQVLISIHDKFNSTGQASLWNLGVWGTGSPWPSCVALSDNRLWFGGNAQIWGSALNDFSNFDDISVDALRPLTRTLGSGGAASKARWFLPLQRLIVGTEGAQVSIRAGAFDEGVTAENVTLRDAATIGANYVSPVKLDGRGVFVHSSGSDVYALKPGDGDYVAERMTVYNDEILDLGVVELAAQRQPETMVWAVRSDGQVPVCMYEFDGELDTKTWWRFITAGDVESVAVLPGAVEDRIYMVVNRTPDPDDESITGAEELAPSGVDVFSADLTDQSVLVVDSGTPANDLNTDQRFDEWGNIVGLETIVSQNTSDLKLTLQSSGYLGYQPHNLAPSSYDLTVSGFRSFSGGVIGTAPNTTYPAPDGVGVMHKIIPATGDSTSGIEFDLNIPGAGSDSARKLVEISFYTKYESGEGDAMTDWAIDIIDASDDSTIASCDWFMDQLAGAPEDDIIFVGSNADESLIFDSYLDDRVINYTGESDGTAFEQPAIAYLEGSTEYLRLRYRFYLDAPEAYVRIYPGGVTADGVRGGYLWGLQVNLLPTADQLAGGYSQLVQHADNAPRILLPYEWDNSGVLEGIKVEPAGENKLVSGTDFTYADFTASSLTVNYTGDDASPDGLSQGTQLLEAAGTSVHKLSHPIIGVDGQYVASTYVYPGELTYLALRLYGVDGESFLANFNVDTGEINLESVSGVTNADAGIEALPFGCYRIWVTGTISVEQPGTMRSYGSTTAAFVSLPEPTIASAGVSTVTWSRAGDVVGAAIAAGTSTATFGGAAPVAAQNLLVNGGFETGSISPWSAMGSLNYLISTGSPPGAYQGSYYISRYTSSFHRTAQILDLVSLGFSTATIDAGGLSLTVSGACTSIQYSGSESARVNAYYYSTDPGDSIFGFTSSENIFNQTIATADVWETFSVDVSIPSGTRYFRIMLYSGGENFFRAIAWDSMSVSEPLPPALTASGTAAASFGGVAFRPTGAIADGGTASASFAGAATVPGTFAGAGVTSTSLVGFPDYRIQSSGTAAATWSPIVSTASSGVAAASFGPPTGSQPFTAAGAATASFAGEAVSTTATFSLILSDVANQTVTSQNEIAFPAEGTRGVVVWGAQLEYNRTRPSSFISRTSTSLRAADAYTIDNASIPLSDTAVSMFAEIKRSHAEAGTILGIADGSDALNLELDSSAQSLHRVRDDGGDVAYIVDGVAVENTLTRLASSAQVDDAKLVVDGGSSLTDTSMTMPAVSGGTTFIGSGYDGIISRIMILPQASSEEALQGYGLVQEPPTYRYIEKLALKSEAIGGSTNKMADSGAFFAGPASTVTCAWLVERSDVVAWATNASGLAVPLTGLTSDVDGNIDLGGTYTNIWVGLGYTARYRSAKLAFQSQGGTALLQRKRVAELGVLLENTHRDALRFGEDFDRMRHMNLVKAGAIQAAGTIYSTYDDKSFSFPGSWNTDARLCLEVQAPYPATLLGLVIGLEWNERGLG